MYRGLRTESQRIVLFTAFCVLIGWLLDAVAWCLIVGGSLYSVFLLRQMQRFYVWLSRHNEEPPPSSSGIWGDIFDAIYRMRKRQAQQQDNLQQQLDRMQQFTAALRDGVVLLDRHGLIGFWNDAAGRLLGLRQHSDEHEPVTNLVRDPHFTSYLQRGDFREPVLLRAPAQRDGMIEIQCTRFGDQEILMVVRDVTRLQALEKMRSDFVANVSHELRTPLTVLKGYLETFEDQDGALAPALRTGVMHMQQQVNRMQHLVDDLLLLSQLENLQPERQQAPVAIDRLALRLQQDAAQLSPDHTVTLDGAPLQLLGNEQALYSAFSNLVANALRYSPPASRIAIAWGTDSQGAFFAVSDEGPGIDAIHIPRLTERFYRVDAGRSRQQGGTGLGLAIVKHALARHQAQLDIRSTPGSGSTFTCRFPPQRIARREQAA